MLKMIGVEVQGNSLWQPRMIWTYSLVKQTSDCYGMESQEKSQDDLSVDTPVA